MASEADEDLQDEELELASTSSSAKSLYVGSLDPHVNEHVLESIFAPLGQIEEVKIIRDRLTGASAGYGFVKYRDHRSAVLALQALNRKILYGQEVRINWAFSRDGRADTTGHHHIFVGDLGSEVTDCALRSAFASFASLSDARVMWDHTTSRSKSYGFVSFQEREDAEAAIACMNGEVLGSRRIRCGWAQHRQDSPAALDAAAVDHADPLNANVWVGCLAPEVGESELRRAFGKFGQVTDVKCFCKGSYAFVSFARHEDAVAAIVEMHGAKLGSRSLRCSWGRHHLQRQQQLASATAVGSLGVMQVHPMAMVPMPAGMLPATPAGYSAHVPALLQAMTMMTPHLAAHGAASAYQPHVLQQALLQQQQQHAAATAGLTPVGGAVEGMHVLLGGVLRQQQLSHAEQQQQQQRRPPFPAVAGTAAVPGALLPSVALMQQQGRSAESGFPLMYGGSQYLP